jgi:phosphatidylglycerol:prolipoprotein diacylglycerol transferase
MTFGVSMGQWLSLPMVLAGIGLMAWAHRRPR